METLYIIGDRIKIRPGNEHDPATKGKVGKIVQISTPALGIEFEGMKGTHKWYVDSEVQRASE